VTPAEAEILMDPSLTGLDELQETANLLTKKRFNNEVELCAIYAARVGLCSGDCAFCAQSSRHSSGVTAVPVSALDDDTLVGNAAALYDAGVRRYSLVTSGERLTDKEFERILDTYRRLGAETKIGLCASLGGLTPERAKRLREAGVTRYHCNIETSPSHFPKICTTHSFEDKVKTITLAREAGMEICSGGIIGMGESPKQRAEMAVTLRELAVDCVPINILNPIPGTRLEDQPPLNVDEILRTIAVFRVVMPDTALRLASGREKALGESLGRAYTAGINAALVGNYLTTDGTGCGEEVERVIEAGLKVATNR
jgi:biotin synthase